jgi:hypothetical protein
VSTLLSITKRSLPFPIPLTVLLAPFAKYPKFKYLKPEVVQLYRKHNYEFYGMTATV